MKLSRTYGGGAYDSATAIATDREGYVILAGNTTSNDFPVTNNSRNAGTQFAVSRDDGRTWAPLSNLPSGAPASVLADPSTAHLWYAGATNGVFRSTDDGLTWQMTFSGQPDCPSFGSCSFRSLMASAARPGVVYALGPRILKSTDSGATWTLLPLPGASTATPYYLAQQPSQPDHLFVALFSAGLYDFQSFDGGQTWSGYSPPLVQPGSSCFSGVFFDPIDTQRFYLSEHCDVFRTTDGGATFQPITNTLPAGTYAVMPDPTRPGNLYASGSGLFRSTDNGHTWAEVIPYNAANVTYVVTDPTHPDAAFAAGFGTQDHGATFTRLPLGREPVAAAFDPHTPRRAIAVTSGAVSGFVTRLNSSGDILTASYFGGQGITNITAATTDSGGSIYVTGTTTSPDFPVTAGAAGSAPANLGQPAYVRAYAFVTKFDRDLQIVYSTFLSEDQLQPNAISVASDGAAVVASGLYTGNVLRCSILKLNPAGSDLLFSAAFGGVHGYTNCTAIAAAPDGQTIAAGSTQDPTFPSNSSPLKGAGDAILLRLSPDGSLLASHLLGGAGEETAVALALDTSGNVYMTGTTNSKDFPVSAGAFQTTLRGGCPYPSSSIATGFIGTITSYRTDDAYIAKFDPAGNRVASTYFGADCLDVPTAIAADSAGHVWIAGTTNSSSIALAMPFESGPRSTYYKAFVTELDDSLQRVILSSYASAGDRPVLALGPGGDAYLGGTSTNPVPPYSGLPAPPPVRNGRAYLAKIQTQYPYPISIRSAGNAFSLRSGPVSPGQITLITADGLVPDQAIDLGFTPSAPLPRTLGGVQVLFDGEPAPIVSVAPGRVVCVAPDSLAGKSWVALQIAVHGTLSNVQMTEIAADRALLTRDGSGAGAAFAHNADGSINSKDNPAPTNSVVTLYVTGAGIVDPACPAGGIAPATGVAVAIDGLLPIAGYLCGYYQMVVRTPPYAGEITPVFNYAITYSVR
ncbi:MAG: SBBP repeat-containing protein [Candidatus Solibacter sp.]